MKGPHVSVIGMRDVRKSFRGTTVLDGVDLDIEAGRTYGLRGPNGSGKSVLLKMMCGFVRPDSGRVQIDEEFLTGGRTFPDRFGIIIDGPAYLPGASARSNLLQLAHLRSRIGAAEVEATLSRVGLDPRSRQRVRSFSLGMKQKLAIAQAIMERPDVLILDEPFNALDESSTAIVRDILADERARGTTIVFTSHIRGDIDDLCDDVLVLDAGVLRRE